MKDKIIKALVSAIFNMILDKLSAENLRRAADMVIDFAKAQVQKSENKIDDKYVLPVLEALDTAFGLPD